MLLGAKDAGVLHQTDTYFKSPSGRLKLREIADATGQRAELIWYERTDEAKSRKSDYIVTPIAHPAELIASLKASMGLRGQVIKTRHLLLWHNVRIHLDEVKNLGSFVEFEAVITDGESEETGHQRLVDLCKALFVNQSNYQTKSYAELLGF